MSFSDAEGEIAVVEFTILDAHDAAMALSLVRAALALTLDAGGERREARRGRRAGRGGRRKAKGEGVARPCR